MILRRVIAHFRKQEWTAIAIDFVIVVVGVFVGIQVSSWNAARVTNRQAAVFTERLLGDLREEAWLCQFLTEYNRDVLANAERALAGLEGRLARNDEALLIAAYRAPQYREARRRRSTYDELISTGAIGLIRDLTLRETAIKVYTSPVLANVVSEGIGSHFREAFRMSVPVEVQRALRDQCGDRDVAVGDYKVIVDMLDYNCATGLAPETLAEAAGALRTNAALAPLLRRRIVDIETRLGDMTVNNKDIMTGLLAIAAEKP